MTIESDAAVDLDHITAYEVCIEALGERCQPLRQAIADEKASANPSQPFIQYCEKRLQALDDLLDELDPKDLPTIRKIFDREAAFQVI